MRKFQEEVLANETKHHLLGLKNRHLELLLQRAQEEIKLYVSSKTEDKKKSLREQLLKQVTAFSTRVAENLETRDANNINIEILEICYINNSLGFRPNIRPPFLNFSRERPQKWVAC